MPQDHKYLGYGSGQTKKGLWQPDAVVTNACIHLHRKYLASHISCLTPDPASRIPASG